MTLLFMVFFHIIDDFYLQGILASMKQKAWWKKQESYCKLYENDYITALATHAWSWTFMIMLPIAFNLGFTFTPFYLWAFQANFVIHAITDHLKANKKKINLCIDQSIHLMQILITFLIFCLV